MSLSMRLLEKGLVPDPLVRAGIRSRLALKLKTESEGGTDGIERRKQAFLERVRQSPISIHTDAANEQHYELPAAFFEKVLGRRLKYSSGLWREGVTDIDRSEEDMLGLTIERADLHDGQKVLELGCGWGSLSLYMAERFPKSRITAVSNSHSQKRFIDARAAERGLGNLEVITAEMSRLELPRTFDRGVSVEMFEHMRNYPKLFEKVSGFLVPQGKMFVHVFTHSKFAYFYEQDDPEDWIARYFFTGGTMPSGDLFLNFQDHFHAEKTWRVPGVHYQKTCRAWLERMDSQKASIVPILKGVYGSDWLKWWNYWRTFFMACEELFGFRGGEEWMVSHYLFRKNGA
jgi:cyclopropane-fatty-acyl-phospholipid synthase